MAGFPFFQLERFLKILVQDLNKHVAISEEFPNDASAKIKSGGLLFDRRVTRVVTSGTLVDEKFMDPYDNNFLLAISPKQPELAPATARSRPLEDDALPLTATAKVGLAWLDLSTGEFFTQATSVGSLSTLVVRIGAREIVLGKTMGEESQKSILAMLGQERNLVTWHPRYPLQSRVADWTPMLEAQVPVSEQNLFSTEEIAAGSMLLDYVRDRLQGLGIKLQPPLRREETENMVIDKNSLKGLEILETSRSGTTGGKGSLLHAVRRTVTKGGARLLRERISSPSTSLAVIDRRLDLVECFLRNRSLSESIVNLLRRTFDSQRLVQKFSLGRGDADDLISLLRTIAITENIASVMQSVASETQESIITHENRVNSIASLMKRLSLEGPTALALRISESIDEDGLAESHRDEQVESANVISMAQDVLTAEGKPDDLEAMSQVVRSKTAVKGLRQLNTDEDDVWIMRRNANSTLEKFHGNLTALRQEKSTLTDTLKSQMEASSLTLRWTPGLGHICHIRGAKDVRSSMEKFGSARNASTTKSTRSFYLPEWSNLGGRIDQSKMQIRAEEQRVFQELREQVVINLVKLRRNAAVLDELDVACSAASLADEQSLVRPILNDSASHIILGGRHATVQLGLEEQGRAFVSNDCFVGDPERIWLITGPNMAGKSTFLRQNALISILAQVGSFVPADHVEIGIVDRIFSRIGSADNLYQDQSTFMVEMLETAVILKQATPRSFVIMDEVGRGTTPEDGIAVGFACLHHLYHTNRCRTLFATHFHALADMTSEWGGVGCYCTDVAETGSGSFSYVHRLRHGVNNRSHALKVATLAGIPKAAIDVASQVLDTFQDSTRGKLHSQPAASAAT
ncbi:DNA mismatch repair ATPase msh1 [Trapelia coarctata]|nr:DNA mismatch repair ATPase msh1 [Trapelia coarctata]